MASAAGGLARSAAVVAIASLAVVYAIPTPEVGWNQTAHYAFVRALAEGTPHLDETRYEVGTEPTGDVSSIDGHYYAAKSPGLALESFVPYLALQAAGGADAVADPSGRLWYLNIWGALLPALVLVVLVRAVGERLQPGYGTVAAVTLGLGTMVLPFATLYFAHVLSALLAFAAFVVLWHERRGAPRLALVGAAGVLAGLAATAEFPVAVVGAIIAVYGLRRGALWRRLAAYVGGAFLGALPTLLYNSWAFGDPFELAYANVDPASGANNAGLFGITAPQPDVLTELLFARIGLLTLMPVLVLGAVGLFLAYRAGQRREALLAGAVCIGYSMLISGYETPFGGWSPGPRFLLVVLPFLALGLPAAYRRFPLTTAVLAACSVLEMTVITLTKPLQAVFGGWFGRFAEGDFGQTSLGLLGARDLSIGIFFLAAAAAMLAAAVATPWAAPRGHDGSTALLALAGWTAVAYEAPRLLDANRWPIALCLAAAVLVLVVFVPRLAAARYGRRSAPTRRQ